MRISVLLFALLIIAGCNRSDPPADLSFHLSLPSSMDAYRFIEDYQGSKYILSEPFITGGDIKFVNFDHDESGRTRVRFWLVDPLSPIYLSEKTQKVIIVLNGEVIAAPYLIGEIHDVIEVKGMSDLNVDKLRNALAICKSNGDSLLSVDEPLR